MEDENILEYLRGRLLQGNCLHGSQQRIEGMLEPRQARCETGRLGGCQKAVYASPNCIRVPLLMAMFSPIDSSRGYRSSYSGDPLGTLVVSGENVTFQPGFVYVLPTETFTWVDGEYISYQPVFPCSVLQVTPRLLLLLPNLDLRIPVPAMYR